MIRAKYGLAIVKKLLEAFGSDIGCGYDIGCKFKSTLAKSPLGPEAKEKNFRCLVPAFHGHAHGRLCQLDHLANYILGLGLEDLEGCERAFSKSNALAGALRHASIFHRRQSINDYFEHNDKFEVYQNLSKLSRYSTTYVIDVSPAKFLHNNYKQALNILKDCPQNLSDSMKELGISHTDAFAEWLAEEKTYLSGLKREPEVETLQMEYWQKLINYEASQ